MQFKTGRNVFVLEQREEFVDVFFVYSLPNPNRKFKTDSKGQLIDVFWFSINKKTDEFCNFEFNNKIDIGTQDTIIYQHSFIRKMKHIDNILNHKNEPIALELNKHLISCGFDLKKLSKYIDYVIFMQDFDETPTITIDEVPI